MYEQEESKIPPRKMNKNKQFVQQQLYDYYDEVPQVREDPMIKLQKSLESQLANQRKAPVQSQPEEEKKCPLAELDDCFEQIDKRDFESFNFGNIDINESMHVDKDDYSIIMMQK